MRLQNFSQLEQMKVARRRHFSGRTFLITHLKVGNIFRICYYGCSGYLHRCRDDMLPSRFEDHQQWADKPLPVHHAQLTSSLQDEQHSHVVGYLGIEHRRRNQVGMLSTHAFV